MKRKKSKKVLYNVQCAFNKDHIFEKVFEVEEETEKLESEMETFCPFCNKMVTITVKGKVALNDPILRKFEK